eukprot:jgi/Mesen1/658/ME000109S10876
MPITHLLPLGSLHTVPPAGQPAWVGTVAILGVMTLPLTYPPLAKMTRRALLCTRCSGSGLANSWLYKPVKDGGWGPRGS